MGNNHSQQGDPATGPGWITTASDHFVLTEGENGRLYAVSLTNESQWVYSPEQESWQRLESSVSNWAWSPEAGDWLFTGKREGEPKVDQRLDDGQSRLWEIHHTLFLATPDGFFLKHGGDVAARRPEAGLWHEVTEEVFDNARVRNQDLQTIWETPDHPGQARLAYTDGALKALEKGMEIYVRSAVLIAEHVTPWGKAAAFIVNALDTDEALQKAQTAEERMRIVADAWAPGLPGLPGEPGGLPTRPASTPADLEFEGFRAWVRQETGAEPRAGEPLTLQPHAWAGKARQELDLPGTHESAHGLPQSVGRGVDGYSPRAAVTTLQERAAHRSIDRHWKEAFQQMRREGKETATAMEVYDTVVDSIQRSDLPQGIKDSLQARLADEMFVEFGLDPGTQLDLPYPNVKPGGSEREPAEATEKATGSEGAQARPEAGPATGALATGPAYDPPDMAGRQPGQDPAPGEEQQEADGAQHYYFDMERDAAAQTTDLEKQAEENGFRMDLVHGLAGSGELPDHGEFIELPDYGETDRAATGQDAAEAEEQEDGG